ncbi:peptide chain release factor N(5)-glutamine methyltransferase [Patescibacteria group bacterium]|nr:MAG: peptide chain release factor N(5)-glutamine methyltransferase [Patescibacteria group bacterium]
MKFVKGSGLTMQDVLEQGRKILKKAKIEQSDPESELILSAAIRKPREFIYTHPEYALSRSEKGNFANFIKRRAKRLPLAYIIGVKEFYGLAFFVNKNVLIPRPETEGLIDLALKEINEIRQTGIDKIDIIDIGTGSGAIILSLAKTILGSRIMNDIAFFAVDKSKKSLIIAQENAKRLGVNEHIQFLHGNLIQPYLKSTQRKRYKIQDARYKIFLANLPYLTSKEMKNLQPEVRYEPRQALDGGKDGLDVYRSFFKQLAKLQNNPFAAICEIAPGQKNEFLKIVKASLPQSATEFIKDLSSRTRFAAIENPPR